MLDGTPQSAIIFHMNRRIAMGIAFLICLLSALAFSQDNYGTVYGIVTDEKKVPLEGAKVSAYYETKNPESKNYEYIFKKGTTTDKKGKFRLELEIGYVWVLKYELSNYCPACGCSTWVEIHSKRKTKASMSMKPMAECWEEEDCYCAPSSYLDPTSTSIGHTITLDMLENIPLSSPSR